jgi:hypothetical protein
MDVDFSHPGSLLPLMVSRINGGADAVIGSCYVGGGGTAQTVRTSPAGQCLSDLATRLS